MRYVIDVHSHSGYAGGVGDISLADVARTMALKGINLFGVGDCLQPAWLDKLSALLMEAEPGLFALADADRSLAPARFVMQTEIIVTSPVSSGGRKGTHVVLLFPGFAAAREALGLLLKWDVKADMGRPFLKCADPADVAAKFTELLRIDQGVMVIPAHVMTPQGVYGSDHPVERLAEVFGEFAGRISTFETGLSADPELLCLLPELDGKTLISNSDCHSGALNRVGREFTALDIPAPSYDEVVRALRGGRVAYTAEFNPAEGRFFLTGHRAGLEGHGKGYCYYSPGLAPADGLCPVCGKKLTVGVLDRVLHLSETQRGEGGARKIGSVRPRQIGRRLVPLVEVLAAGLGVKSVSGRKVLELFNKIVAETGTEIALWERTPGEIRAAFSGLLPEAALRAIVQVAEGDFSFQPGFDGEYGRLCLGERIDWFGQQRVMHDE